MPKRNPIINASVSNSEGESDLSRPNASRPLLKLAIVIPCYQVADQIGDVLRRIGAEVSSIYCIDDCSPEGIAAVEEAAADDTRVQTIRHERNMGVGAAVVTGYRQALADGADIIIKLDGDGQMAPEDIPELVEPIIRGEADYVKGNRFFNLENLRSMPSIRLVGNAGLSFISKLSSGYWNLFDPTNGFTAIHSTVAALLPLDKLSRRYFFESDVLFRLNTLRAVAIDVPIQARYSDEKSSLNVLRALFEFPVRHLQNLAKRLFYNYFLRDFNAASINLIVGMLLLAFGVVFGATHWIRGSQLDLAATPGTVMLAALPVILGSQFLLSFVNFDLSNIPRDPIHRRLRGRNRVSVDS